MMKLRVVSVFLILGILAAGVLGQTAPVNKGDLSQADIDRIIKKFTENEGDFRVALRSYAFDRFATVNIIGMGGQIAGTFRRDSFMTFNSDGERFEKIVFAPVATTPPGFITPQDLEDLGGVNPFALEPRNVSQYNFSYVGRESLDGFNLYVFDVTPKVIPNPDKSAIRLFTGRVWVDVNDLMIVKSKGKGVPETKKNKFPVVETWRESIDGKYWFPFEARSDDELVFDDGGVVKIRMRVKYKNYRLGRSEVRILDDVPDPTPSPTPKQNNE